MKRLKNKYDIKQLNTETEEKRNNPNLDHRWYVYLDKKKYRFSTEEKLIAFLAEREAKLLPETATLASLYDGYIAFRATTQKDGTLRKDVNNWHNFIEPSPLSKIPISEIDIDDAVAFFNFAKAKKKAGGPEFRDSFFREKYWNNVKGTVSTMFDYAVKKRLIASNIFTVFHPDEDLFDDPLEKTANDLIFTSEEKALLKAECFKEAEATKESKFLIPILLFNTGARDGEVLALKKSDFSDGVVNIHAELSEAIDAETKKFAGLKYVDHTKSKAGKRSLDLNSEVKKVVRLCNEYNSAKGYDSDFLFVRSWQGEVDSCTPRTVYSILARLEKKLGFSTIKSPHDIRRTFATDLAYMGVPIKEISKLMGHSSIAQTEDYIVGKSDFKSLSFLEAII